MKNWSQGQFHETPHLCLRMVKSWQIVKHPLYKGKKILFMLLDALGIWDLHQYFKDQLALGR